MPLRLRDWGVQVVLFDLLLIFLDVVMFALIVVVVGLVGNLITR